MKYSKNLYTLLAAIVISFTACAQSKKANTIKAGTAYARLVECAEQTTLPGRPESEPTHEKRIVIIWRQNTAPENFFWRAEDGWAECGVSKVKKIATTAKPRYEMGENWYHTENINIDKIKRGDTLELRPYSSGKNTIPAGITDKMKNSIFFKTKSSGWMFIAVKNCITRPSVVMP